MALELLFTSAVQGLKSGSQGYCTVQCTQAMPGPLAERLEALSAYRPIYPSQSEQAKLNPVNVAYWRIRAVGKTFPVLSRIADYGLDYSQRTNKLAHHLVLEPSELSVAGPAAIAASGSAFVTHWNQKVESIQQPRRLPVAASSMGVCRHWQTVMGDAGWAGVVAEEIIKDQKQPIFLIFEPGQEVLPLIVEVQSLLPASLRWKSTFSTYLTYLPPEAECQIRCLLKGSKEAHESLRHVNSLRIDLTQPKSAPSGPLAEAARTGVMPVQLKKVEPATAFDYESDEEPPALPGHQSFAAEPLQLQVDESGRRPGLSGRRKNYNAAPVLPQKSGRTRYIVGGVVGGLMCVIAAVVAMQVMKTETEKPTELVENVVQVEPPVVSEPEVSATVVSQPIASVMSAPLTSVGEVGSANVASNEGGKPDTQSMPTTPEKTDSTEGGQQMNDDDFRNLGITKGMPETKPLEDQTLYSSEIWKQGVTQDFDFVTESKSPVTGVLSNVLFPSLNWKDGNPRELKILGFTDRYISTIQKEKDDSVSRFFRFTFDNDKLTISGGKQISDKTIPALLMQSVVVVTNDKRSSYISLFPPIEYEVGGGILTIRAVKDLDVKSKSLSTLSQNDSSWPLLSQSVDSESLRLVFQNSKLQLPLVKSANKAELEFIVSNTDQILSNYDPDIINKSVREAFDAVEQNGKSWNVYHARSINPPKFFVRIKPTAVELKFDEKFSEDVRLAITEIDQELRQDLHSSSFKPRDDKNHTDRVNFFYATRDKFRKSLNDNKSALEKIRDEVAILKGTIQYSVFDPVKDKKITFDFIRFKEPQQ
jgi:hypothetical protein